jgi:hypothetical protein
VTDASGHVASAQSIDTEAASLADVHLHGLHRLHGVNHGRGRRCGRRAVQEARSDCVQPPGGSSLASRHQSTRRHRRVIGGTQRCFQHGDSCEAVRETGRAGEGSPTVYACGGIATAPAAPANTPPATRPTHPGNPHVADPTPHARIAAAHARSVGLRPRQRHLVARRKRPVESRRRRPVDRRPRSTRHVQHAAEPCAGSRNSRRAPIEREDRVSSALKRVMLTQKVGSGRAR